MYCKYLKLVNGDNVIVSTEDDCKSLKNKEFLNCLNPVQVGTVRFPRGNYIVESHVLQPWIKMLISETVQIPISSIVVIVDIDEDAIKQYNKFVENTSQLNNDDISLHEETFEQDQDMIHELLNALTSNESEEEDDDGIDYRSRTIH